MPSPPFDRELASEGLTCPSESHAGRCAALNSGSTMLCGDGGRPWVSRMGTERVGGKGEPCSAGRTGGSCGQARPVLLISILLLLSPSGEQCGGCRRSNTTDRPHSFQVILTDRPSLELSAENEEDMADWMQYFCQAVSKGVSQGRAPGRGRVDPLLTPAGTELPTAPGSDRAGSFLQSQKGFPTGHPVETGLPHTGF